MLDFYETFGAVLEAVEMGGVISAEGKKMLDISLAEEEQKRMISLCSDLLAENDINGIIDCAGYGEGSFVLHYRIAPKTMSRWRNEGLTEFEREALIFLICLDEIAEDRTHYCPTCGKIFTAYVPTDGLCADCRVEILKQTDDFLRSWRIW